MSSTARTGPARTAPACNSREARVMEPLVFILEAVLKASVNEM